MLLLVTAGNIRRSTECEMVAAARLAGRIAKFTFRHPATLAGALIGRV
jgi:hypothetical protein